MPFDQSKDKTVATEIIETEKNDQFIEVKVASYDGGPEKVRVGRFIQKDDGRDYRKLGGMTFDEAKQVRDAITKLIGD